MKNNVEFLRLVTLEIQEARKQHPQPINSGHEAFGVIYEELDEFWDEVREKKLNKEKALHELVQTAAMCMRAAEDLGLMNIEEDDEEKERQNRRDVSHEMYQKFGL